MGVIGKGSSSFRKKDVMEQKGIALGFKKIRFAHKATVGDTGIDLTSLVQPTEMAANGFVNPTSAEIARAQINLFRNNLKLVSSLRGLLVDQLSYVVSSASQINFLDFTAEEDEIFTGWLDEAPTTSLQVVDGKTIIASGILAAGNTDFNIGTPIEINKNPAQQIGAVMVFADRGLQYRKAGNVVSGDGDYIEVPVAGGLGSLLRFTASGSDRFITVVSNGVVAERPDGSMTAMIERVQGQIDQMVPTLAAVAGVPESTFQLAPNDIDLKQFGDTVIDQQNTLDDHETRIQILENARTTGSFNYTFNGIGFSASQVVTINWEKIGNKVTLYVDPRTALGQSPGQIYITGGSDVPSNLRPAATFVSAIVQTVDNGSTFSVGEILVFSTGAIRVYKNASETGTFTTATQIGWNYPLVISYLV